MFKAHWERDGYARGFHKCTLARVGTTNLPASTGGSKALPLPLTATLPSPLTPHLASF